MMGLKSSISAPAAEEGGPQQVQEEQMSNTSSTLTASRSTVRRWIEKIADDTGNKVIKSHAEELALTIRQVSEGAMVGAVLGGVDHAVGLDVEGIPVDLALSIAGTGGALYFAREGFSHELRNVGSHSLAIFSFRKTKHLLEAMKAVGIGGEDDEDPSDAGEEDPVVRAAREL